MNKVSVMKLWQSMQSFFSSFFLLFVQGSSAPSWSIHEAMKQCNEFEFDKLNDKVIVVSSGPE